MRINEILARSQQEPFLQKLPSGITARMVHFQLIAWVVPARFTTKFREQTPQILPNSITLWNRLSYLTK